MADARSDVFALGAVLFRLLTDREPSASNGTDAYATRTADPRLALLDAGAPARFGQLVARALARDPAARMASAGVFLRELEAAARGDRLAVQPAPAAALPDWASRSVGPRAIRAAVPIIPEDEVFVDEPETLIRSRDEDIVTRARRDTVQPASPPPVSRDDDAVSRDRRGLWAAGVLAVLAFGVGLALSAPREQTPDAPVSPPAASSRPSAPAPTTSSIDDVTSRAPFAEAPPPSPPVEPSSRLGAQPATPSAARPSPHEPTSRTVAPAPTPHPVTAEAPPVIREAAEAARVPSERPQREESRNQSATIPEPPRTSPERTGPPPDVARPRPKRHKVREGYEP